MASPLLAYLKYRVVNPNTGVVVVQDLAHLHQSKWTVRALIAGVPGAATLGEFTIPLHPPTSDEGKRNFNGASGAYDQIAIGHRIEGFLGDVLTGTPAFTGVITGFDRPMDGDWVLRGHDSLFWLQQSQLFTGELLPSNAAFLDAVRTVPTVTWDDDFSLWNTGTHPNSTDYNVTGWTFESADSFFGLPALKSIVVSPTIAYATTTTAWNAFVQFEQCQVTIIGHLSPGTDVGVAGEAAILLLSDATPGNAGAMVRARLAQVSTGTYDIFGEIYTIAGGTYTLQQSAKVFSAVTLTNWIFEVSAVISTTPGGSTQNVRCVINGQDAGITYSAVLSPGAGRIGLRFSPAAGGSPSIEVNRLLFRSRNVGVFRFTTGSISGVPTLPVSQIINGQTHLDLLQMCLVNAGAQARKNPGFEPPGVGGAGDSFDFGTSLGTDRSGQVVFREGENVLAQGTALATIGELYSTDTRLNSVPGPETGGSATWSRIGQIGDMVLTDTVADAGLPGFLQQMLYAEILQQRKINPLQATQVTITRTPECCAPETFRELDQVLVDIPTLALHRLKEQVVGFSFTEGSPEQTVWLATFPALDQLRALLGRVSRPVEFLTNTYKAR